MPFFEREQTRAVTGRHSATCRCIDIDYALVNEGVIECRACGRQWRLRGRSGWWPYPCPGCNKNPEHCPHYGKRQWKKKAD